MGEEGKGNPLITRHLNNDLKEARSGEPGEGWYSRGVSTQILETGGVCLPAGWL